MIVRYLDHRERLQNESVESFVYRQVQMNETYRHSDSRHPLEHQPTNILAVISRLLDKLLEKKILTADEFFDIIDTRSSDRQTARIEEDVP